MNRTFDSIYGFLSQDTVQSNVTRIATLFHKMNNEIIQVDGALEFEVRLGHFDADRQFSTSLSLVEIEQIRTNLLRLIQNIPNSRLVYSLLFDIRFENKLRLRKQTPPKQLSLFETFTLHNSPNFQEADFDACFMLNSKERIGQNIDIYTKNKLPFDLRFELNHEIPLSSQITLDSPSQYVLSERYSYLCGLFRLDLTSSWTSSKNDIALFERVTPTHSVEIEVLAHNIQPEKICGSLIAFISSLMEQSHNPP